MAYKIIHRGAVTKRDGIKEILESKQCPAAMITWGRGRTSKSAGKKGDGEYVSGLADYVGDPNAFCSTRQEAKEKLKRKGLQFEAT